MGDVREAIERKTPTPDKPSPTADLVRTGREVADLLTTKRRDLATEGAAAEGKNRISIGKLETAAWHIDEAVRVLRSY